MNSDKMHRDILSNDSYAARLAASDVSDADVATQLYRRIYGRNPNEDEVQLVADLLSAKDANRRHVIEDLMWAMLNTAEFVFQD